MIKDQKYKLNYSEIVIDAQRTKKAFMQFADSAGTADLGLRCSLTELIDTVVYVDKQRRSRSDCTDAHAHLDLRCRRPRWLSWAHLDACSTGDQ